MSEEKRDWRGSQESSLVEESKRALLFLVLYLGLGSAVKLVAEFSGWWGPAAMLPAVAMLIPALVVGAYCPRRYWTALAVAGMSLAAFSIVTDEGWLEVWMGLVVPG